MEKFKGGKIENKKIADTIEVLPFGDGSRDNTFNLVKKSIASLPENSSLRNSLIALAEMKSQDKYNRDNFFGVSEIEKILAKEPDKKILVLSIMGIGYVRKMKPEIDRILMKNNVRFAELTDLISKDKDKVGKVSKIFDTESANTPKNEKAIELSKQNISKKISYILHIFENYGDPYNPDSSNSKYLNNPKDYKFLVEKGLTQAREEFPAMAEKSDKEVLDFLFQTRENFKRPEVMKGENIKGIFCDIEGTLILNGKVNEKVLNKLKEYEKAGKSITLWTDGNIKELQKVLTENKIKYPLKSKFDYAGAIAETVIDDADENTFNARTQIFAKEFIRV